jgi:catechol 2,3-dioxygenase-like lactoylglutathione lyase family enzyme
MALVDQWNTIQTGLDPRWSEAQLVLTVDDESRAERAAALLGPAGPGRSGATVRFRVTRGGSGVGPEAARRMLSRLDADGISGSLELVATAEAPVSTAASRSTLATGWDEATAVLPADWSDLLCEIHLTSSDHIDLAALHLSPLNPLHARGESTLRFRVAHTFGYGASPGMVRRCLERVDAAGVPGEVRILRALSDTHPVGTQGPVWYVGGKAV